MATIGVVHMGWQGHLAPACRLSAALSRLGHRVLAWAPEGCRAQVEASGAALRPLEPPDWDRAPVSNHALGLRLIEAALDMTDQLAEELAAAGVELVVHDAMALWGRTAAATLGRPRICSLATFPPPYPREWREDASPLAGALARAGATVAERSGAQLGDLQDVLLSPGDATFVYSTPAILGAPLPDASWHAVGPLLDHCEDEHDPALAPDDGVPLVYVALGTTFNARTDVFSMVLEALAGLPVRVLVATAGLPDGAIAGVPANARVVAYVRSRAVLPRAAVHVTHAGAGSVAESLYAGVPMVCIPLGADNILWATRLDALGLAEALTSPTAGSIRAAVEFALADEELRSDVAAAARGLAAYPGLRVVREAVESLLGP